MITSRSNKWLKLIREVRRGKVRNLWLIEGSRATLESMENGLSPLAILADPKLTSAEILNRLHLLAPQKIILTAGNLLDESADQDSPPGLLALFPRDEIDRSPRTALPGLYFFADRIQDPRNLGALIRVGMAFGARGIFVSSGSCSVNHPRVVRSSVGLVVKAPIHEQMPIDSVIEYLKELSPMIAALDARGTHRLHEVQFPKSVLLLIGTEGQGLSEDLLAISTLAVSIRMSSPVESLNLATAAAIACYEFTRQRGL